MGLRESIAGVTPFAEISRGRMTIVYKGFDPSHDRFVLLKILRPEYSRLPVVARKFGNEASLLAKVSHPNVVTVLTAGTDGDTAYLVTEFVEGVSLSELLRQRLPPPEIAAFIAKRILSGLGAAHEAGVLHRDLKPDNVLISADGQVKISDFGLAVDTKNVVDEQPLIAGTLGFLAPEVVAGQAPTVLSDLFSCGATLYEMLTGQAAFGGHSDGQVIDAVLNHNPMNGVEEFSSAPAGLLVLCSRMLRKDPTDRVASCEDAVGAIDRWFVDSGLNTEPSDLARYVADPLAYPKVAVGDPAKTSTLTQHPPTGRTIRWAAAAAIVVLLGFATIVVSRTAGTDPTVDRAAQQDSVRAAALGPAQGSNPGSTDALQNRQRDRSPAELGDQAAETGTAAFPPAAAPARHGQSSSDEGKPRVENETVPSTLLASPAQNHQDSDVAAGTVGGALTDGPSTPQSQQAAPTDKQRIDDVVTGTLSVRSVPWASVWLDGEPYGTSLTDSLELVPGSYELVLRNPEFPDVIRTVDVEAGAHRVVEISLWSTVARLTLMVVPWAIVEIDGAVRDTIPPQTKPLILSPGTHTLRLIHPELGDIVRDVRLIAGEERILAYNMRQASAQ